MAEYSWVNEPETLKEIVANYVKLIGRENSLTNGIPDDDWVSGFRQVHMKETAMRAFEERKKLRKQTKADAAKRPTKLDYGAFEGIASHNQ